LFYLFYLQPVNFCRLFFFLNLSSSFVCEFCCYVHPLRTIRATDVCVETAPPVVKTQTPPLAGRTLVVHARGSCRHVVDLGNFWYPTNGGIVFQPTVEIFPRIVLMATSVALLITVGGSNVQHAVQSLRVLEIRLFAIYDDVQHGLCHILRCITCLDYRLYRRCLFFPCKTSPSNNDIRRLIKLIGRSRQRDQLILEDLYA